MKIVNIDLTKPNWREEAKKISQYPIEFTLIDNLEEDTPRYISSMSGGLEHKLYNILAKIYIKTINKALKYKKNMFE
tara:strand:+ start:128 stop:358 length:231 start_codon:yes stop_codon:yes gene_type:complete